MGVGLHLPSRVVTNQDLEKTLDTSDEWIRDRTGIRERRWLEPGLTTSDMCLAAAQEALEDSGVRAAEIGAVIVATSATYDQPLPSMALMVRDALGATNAIPLDLSQSACAGGVYGMFLGSHLLQNDLMRNVLVIGADCFSRVTDPQDRTTRIFFGDAAGAVVMGRSAPARGLMSWDMNAALSHSVSISAGGATTPTTPKTAEEGMQYLRMDGRTVWREATKWIPESIRLALKPLGALPHEVDHYIVHQANLRILQHVMDDLQVPHSRAEITVDRYGNTGAASIFTALHQATRGERIAAGDLLVISGIGAGFTWGTLCLIAE
ncbi:3-oxoacyl-ACP synthase III family protein [Streptomyces tailanensis]|uniref:3-oxoacyl-ACP synthase III family protein n=1 Tax=Streptomyces tailanensis TaxID=2569858 RepID=UPI001FE3AFAC|nr:ketoacyl-ACP synthase III [Streptomyces tailanensis]